ncbi:MAG: DNA primase [Pseudomonadales bacterium]|nr:DNA primase [Pseudomonadales bacterium]
MSRRIPETFIDDMLARTDVVDLIDTYVPLKKAGKNYSACCPFHQEKTPSFTVSPDKQFFYCFGCGASGNAVGFLMDYSNLGFLDAITKLAEINGVEIPTESQDIPAQNNKPIYSSLEQASHFFQQQLRHHNQKQKAVDYLKSRGLSGQIAKDFELGYAPPGWDNLIETIKLQSNPENALTAAINAGLIIEKDQNRHYDRFRDRIMFPIKDKRGRVIAFGGRVMGDDKPKYLNSPETPVFHKGKELYGFYQALKKDRKLQKALIVEGYMDVIALAQQDIHYAMATLGTATSTDHLETLFRVCDEVVFCFDGDAAGTRAAWRGLENALPSMRDGRQVKFLFLPEGEDPDTLVRKEGKALFENRITHATPLSEYLFDNLSSELNIQTMDGRAALAVKAKPFLDKLPVGVFKQLMLDQLAKITELDLDKLVIAIDPTNNQDVSPTTPASFSHQEPNHSDYPEEMGNHYSDQEQHSYNNNQYTSNQHSNDPYSNNQHSNNQHSNNPYPNNQEQSRNRFGKSYNKRFNKPKPARTKVRTAPLVDQAIRLLLLNPELAQSTEIPESLHKIELPNSELFFSLLELFRKSPNTSTAYLFGLWHETEKGRQLARLASQEFLVKGHEKHEIEFNDAIKRLNIQFVEQAIDQESKSRTPDGNRLKELLNLKTVLVNLKTELE